MEPVLDEFNEVEATDTDQELQTDTDRTDGEEETTTTPSQSRSSSIRPQPHLSFIENDVDVFDGYSFKGRHSVLIDDDDDEEEEEDSFGEEESIEEEEGEDNLSILERLEEEAAQIGETKSVVGDDDGDGGDGEDGGDDDVSVRESVLLLDDNGVEPKTPEARRAATLPPVEEVVVSPVVEEVVPPVEEVVVPPAVEELVPPVEEVVVPPVVEGVVPPVEEGVVPPVEEVVLPVADEAVSSVPEVDETLTEATKVAEGQVEPKVEEKEVTPVPEVLPTSRRSVEELDDIEPAKEANGEIVPAKELNGALVDTKESNGQPTTPPPKAVSQRQAPTTRGGRNRREKSGVFALDRYLSDAIDEATEAERDEEDDDWDFVEAADGEDRNGTKGPSLFARGVVDRYRLAVFRIPTSRSGTRSVSGMSNASGTTVMSELTESPSPSQRRGRTPGLTFRKNPRQFLRPKSPPTSFSAKTARSMSQSASSNILSAASTSSSGGGRLLSASHSVGSTFALSPSLKSKESAMSVGAQSQSSDQSANGTTTSAVFVDAADTIRGCPQLATTKGAEHKVKNKKLRRYKHNAEKVFSLFSSPRQAS